MPKFHELVPQARQILIDEITRRAEPDLTSCRAIACLA
jgi:hypothetical protein